MKDHSPQDGKAAREALWKHLSDERVAMLRVKGSDQHPQPMTVFADADGGTVWFITSADTDLFRAIGPGAEAELTLQADGNGYIASLSGRLDPSQDEKKLDELWSFAAAAWFEKGREDPSVRLVRFTPREASVWASRNNPVIVGLKLMRSAMTEGDADPGVGTHDVFRLDLAA
ncbi:pyridoxamine 5'-phosphate oxidase family protein [Roseibacterium sp. SDUM158017]|uniref:pyridoxamine 5'-phosphate oxidase family protein n=1 Tax=Roseicyclus salinarum TaxID=3036773 RepID=UPI0024154792|nr:pyridoxamine 5'-phosphate oxidase family protein [Roseibacterium sp. SDUM158017]MDG4647795.1 pyridoxamine 5'-phosphate oxidase family protein [Roseibacterium sp. SDUM158017]